MKYPQKSGQDGDRDQREGRGNDEDDGGRVTDRTAAMLDKLREAAAEHDGEVPFVQDSTAGGEHPKR